jgi:long-chain acyl-CoA synthetase
VTNFAEQLSAAAAEAPDKPGVKLDDIVIPWSGVDGFAAKVAGLLRAKGVGAGDRVGLQMPNVPYFPFIYYGILRLGAVVVPMNPLLKDREVAYHLSDSGAKVLFAWHGFAEAAEGGARDAGVEAIMVSPGEFEQTVFAADAVEEVTERDDDDAAVIIYTSGTTGTPKGATLTHANITAGAHVGRDLVDAGPDAVALATLPLFHVFGMNSVMNVTVLARGLLTLLPRFEPGKALEIIQRDK